MGKVSDKIILSVLYNYYEAHRGEPEMTFNELYETIGISLDDRKTLGQVWYELHSLKKKEWIDFKSFKDSSSGLVWITPEGIKVVKGIRRVTDPTSESETSELPEEGEDEKAIRQTVFIEPSWPATLEDLIKSDEICHRLFHRDDLINKIKERFYRKQDHFIVLYGEPMVGKTKLLQRLPEALAGEYVPLMVDIYQTSVYSLENYLFDLAIQLTDKFRDWTQCFKIPFSLKEPNQDDFGEGRGERAFNTHWDNLRRNAGERQLVVMFDELDSLLDSSDKLDPKIFIFLRYFLRDPQNGCFIMAGSERILRHEHREFRKLVASGQPIRMRYYSKDLILNVFSVFQKCFAVDKALLQRLGKLCDGQPRLFKVMCEVAIERIATKSPGGRELEESELEEILDLVIQQANAFLWDLWGSLESEEEAVVRAVAEEISGLSSKLDYSMDDLAELAGRLAMPATDYGSLKKGVDLLAKREWIEWTDKTKEQFHFKLGIVPLWVQREYL